jgi:hypothetical protein
MAALSWQSFIFMLLCIPAVAQTRITLPEVAAAKNRGCKVFSTWKPSKKFLQHNPSFLQDGSYTMSVQLINRRKFNYRVFHVGFPGHTLFTSAEYSAVQVLSSKKITTDGTTYVQLFGRNDSDALYPIQGPANIMVSTTGYDFSAAFPKLLRGYDKLNKQYKQETQTVAGEKFSCRVDIPDLGYTLTDTAHASLHDLFFQFEYVESQAVNNHFLTSYLATFPPFLWEFLPWSYPLIFTRKKSNDVYPSNLLLKLHVKNGAGEEIKTYGQVIFVREKHKSSQMMGNAASYTAQIIFKQALPVAMENLLSRFAEDTAATKYIDERNRRLDELVRRYPELATYLAQQCELATINDTKHLLEQSINEITKEIIQLCGAVNANNSLDAPVNPSAGASVNMGAALGAGLATGITNGIIRKQVKQLTDKQYDMREQYARLEGREQRITDAQAATMQNKELLDAWHSIGAGH